MDHSEYDQKVKDILDTDTYTKKNPIPLTERKVAAKLLSLNRSTALPTPLYRHLRPSSSKCPRFFGLPKICDSWDKHMVLPQTEKLIFLLRWKHFI